MCPLTDESQVSKHNYLDTAGTKGPVFDRPFWSYGKTYQKANTRRASLHVEHFFPYSFFLSLRL